MLRYEHVENSDDEEGNCIVASKAEHHNDFRVARAPFFRERIADVEGFVTG